MSKLNLNTIGTRQRSLVDCLMQSQYRCLNSSQFLCTRGRWGGDLPAITSLVGRGYVYKFDRYNDVLFRDETSQFNKLTKSEKSRLVKRMDANQRASTFYLLPDRLIRQLRGVQNG